MATGIPMGAEIVERIAAREGVDPVDLDVQLYDAIDADALDALTNGADDRRPHPNLLIEFTYHGYTITVDGTGSVTIDELPLAADADESAREGTADG